MNRPEKPLWWRRKAPREGRGRSMAVAAIRRRKDRAGKGRRPAPVAAAIDLGTNNCRLLVGTRVGPPVGGRLRILDSYSRVVRLGEGVALSGRFSDAAIERTLAALKVCAARLQKNNVTRLRAIATEACRRAANAQVLVERARAETGIALDIISAEEEAHIAAMGCAPLIGEGYEGALVFDIGGGSTELIWMRRTADSAASAIVHAISAPVGVVALSERYGGAAADFEVMRADLMPLFASLARGMAAAGEFPLGTHHLLGTSGTVTTLAAIALGLPRYDRARVDASWHDTADMLAVVDRLARLDAGTRQAMGCIGRERADLMLPGCAIFSAIAALWPCARLRVADRGVREGILRDLIGLTA